MASKNLVDFEKAIEYMDPMEVNNYLHKTLDFLKRNNNEVYFPSISPYVEAFLVHLVSDTRNLMSQSFKHENRKLASEIIEILEMARDVFRWTHSYENGNLLVYKKIFSNKMKIVSKPSSIAHRLRQPQTQQSMKSPTTGQTPLPIDLPDIPATSTSFKLKFISKTLRFIKDENESTLYYKEMPWELAEYIYSLIMDQDKEVGFGYKSLYAPLWEAMEEYSVDYNFDVSFEEAGRDIAVLKLEKVPKHNKSKRDETRKEIPEIMNNVNGKKDEISKNKSPRNKDKQNQSLDQCLNITSPGFPQLELLSNISERFFADVVIALTEFAGDQSRATIGFQQLAEEEIAFVKRVKTLAESSKVRGMFPPKYSYLLFRLDLSIKEVLKTCKITTTVNDKDRSITLKKTPRFPAPLPVTQSVATGARSKSVVPAKSRDRSISKDRMIHFQKGGKLPATGDVEMAIDNEGTTDNDATTEREERGRSRDGLSKRTAKLLEDLSTPVESDRGIRMMMLMGWNGGALGARGDGIMEPVMPKIDQPTRGGLGHVPPPKPPKTNPRRPLDFRLTILHSIYDLLLHDDMQKEIQLKEPLVGKEANFIQSALSCLNNRRCMSLTGQENELVSLIVGELARKPGVQVRHEFSIDFKTIILKLTNQPANHNQPVKSSKPPPVKKQSEVITITDDDVDMLITMDDVYSVIPHVDMGEIVTSSQKAVKRRAARLLVLTKFAEVLHWDRGGDSRIIYKFTFTLPKKLKLFIRTVVDSLNSDARHCDLFGWEFQVYEDLREMVRGSMLSWEAIAGSKYVLTNTPLINEDIHAGPYLSNNNNDNKTDNLNQMINLNDLVRIDNQSGNVFHNDHGSRLVQAIVNTSNITDAIANIELNNVEYEDDQVTRNIHVSPEGISVTINNKRTGYITVKDVNQINAEIDELLSVDLTRNEEIEAAENIITEDIVEPTVTESEAEVNIINECDIVEPTTESEEVNIITERDIEEPSVKESGAEVNIITEDIVEPTVTETDEEVNIITECDIVEPSVTESEEVNIITESDIEEPTDTESEEPFVKEGNVTIKCQKNNNIIEEGEIKVRGIKEITDWDKDIEDLEMTILNIDLDSVVKENSDSDLERAISETELNLNSNIKEEKEIDYLISKRSHSSSVCSQELDPKKVKISCEPEDHILKITPKNLDEKITEELVKQIQTLMSNELDKSGGFLPLLKCHGVQNGGLIYSCHDEDDVAWVKKVIGVANLEVEIVPCNDLCVEKKNRELLIRINSYIPLDIKKIFRKFEIYNLGLDTKYWRVSQKHTDTTYIMFIVSVDEKSFKYICDEKFTLYCGIDKARCSIIY